MEAPDFDKLIEPGMVVLKFGRGGEPHERLMKISRDFRFLSWEAGWFCRKFGRRCTVDLERATKVISGHKTVCFMRWRKRYEATISRSLSIMYPDENGRETSLDMVVATPELYDLWYNGLRAILKQKKDLRDQMSLDDLRLKSYWDKADVDHSGTLDLKEVIQLAHALNINIPAVTIRNFFRKVDVNHDESLNFSEFIKFYDLLCVRPEMVYLWTSLVSNNLSSEFNQFSIDFKGEFTSKKETITLSQFIAFWSQWQGAQLTESEACDLIKSCYGSLTPGASEDIAQEAGADPSAIKISFGMFSSIISHSSMNDLADSAKMGLNQDMQHPLSHYFIASSHNTYLEGDQLTSPSSVLRYVNDLTNGCRCVELDCWNGENGDGPIITHGHTMTGKIGFEDVIRALKEHGFATSPYPIILSIENHCSVDQQNLLVNIMKKHLGDMLATPAEAADNLASPADLRNKVLIKGKRISAAAVAEEEEEDEEEEEEEEVGDGVSASADGTRPAESTSLKHTKSSKSSKSAKPKKAGGGEEHESKTAPALSEMTYLGTGKVKSFDEAVSAAIPADKMCSYSEITTAKNLKKLASVQGWIRHNQRHLSRIYPKGTRIDSSNYDPAPAWAAGNQMVALNYQTQDHHKHVNFGRFRENGNCGYVLKPEYMLSSSARPSGPGVLQVHIISAQQLPKPGGQAKGEIIDPFVIININGTPGDEAEKRTKTITDNGFNPVWNELFQFDVKCPDTAVLTLSCYDADVVGQEFIAFQSLPLNCVMNGLRTVALCDTYGKREREFEFATLLLRIHFTPV